MATNIEVFRKYLNLNTADYVDWHMEINHVPVFHL